MRNVIRMLGGLLALLVVVQTATHAWGSAGINHYVHSGHTIDARFITEAQASGALPFPELLGLILHGLVGGIVIPVAAGLVLLAALVTRRPPTIVVGAVSAVLVWLQIQFGRNAVATPTLALLHGVNAMVLFGLGLSLALGYFTKPATARVTVLTTVPAGAG